MKNLKIKPHIHVLVCTTTVMYFNNINHEEVTIARDRDDHKMIGYKLLSPRGIHKNTDIIEEVKLGNFSTCNNQLISLVTDLGDYWMVKESEDNVDIFNGNIRKNGPFLNYHKQF